MVKPLFITPFMAVLLTAQHTTTHSQEYGGAKSSIVIDGKMQASHSASPITITDLGSANSNGEQTIVIRNDSGKPVIGYAIYVWVSPQIAGWKTSFTPDNPYKSGQKWPDVVNMALQPPDAPEKYTVIDYVLFSDGTRWGPDRGRFSLKLEGLFEGIKMEQTRLRALLESQGQAAVLKELEANSNTQKAQK